MEYWLVDEDDHDDDDDDNDHDNNANLESSRQGIAHWWHPEEGGKREAIVCIAPLL